MSFPRSTTPLNQPIYAPCLQTTVFDVVQLTGYLGSAVVPPPPNMWSTATLAFQDGQSFLVTAPSTSASVTLRSPGTQILTITLSFPNPVMPGYPTTTTTKAFVRTVLVGINLGTLAAEMTKDSPEPLLLAEPFLLVHLARNGAAASAAIIPMTLAGRPWPLNTAAGAGYVRFDGDDAVRLARAAQDLMVHRALAVAPPELWRAPEGIYFVFENSLLYVGLTPGLPPLVETLREALANDATRGYTPMRTPAVIAALGAILTYAPRATTAGTLYGASQLTSPPNRHGAILPPRSTANWARALQLAATRNRVLDQTSAAQYQNVLAPRDLDRDEGVLRWLYVYAAGACTLVRRLGESLQWPAAGQPRFPASMFVYNAREATQTAIIVDTTRGAEAATASRQYVVALQTRLGLLSQPGVPDIANLPTFSAGIPRAIAPDAQARQILGQNKRQGDLLIREGDELLRLRSSTGEIARVRQAASIQATAPAGHPGEVQQTAGGVVLEPTGQFARVLTRAVCGFSAEVVASGTGIPFWLAPGQIDSVLNDVQDDSETQRSWGDVAGLPTSPMVDAASPDSSRSLGMASLPEGGGVRIWPSAGAAVPDNAIDVVVGPVDISRVDRTQNEAEPFEDLLNVLLQGQV